MLRMRPWRPGRLETSDALSILKNVPESFGGRPLGALVTDGVDARVMKELREAFEEEGAMLVIVAPTIAGVEASDGTGIHADERLRGGPSVLWDAVAVLPSADGGRMLAESAAARDFISDAQWVRQGMSRSSVLGADRRRSFLMVEGSDRPGTPARRFCTPHTPGAERSAGQRGAPS